MNGSVFVRRIVHSFSLDCLGFRALDVRGIMVGGNQVLERVEQRALEAEEMVELLKQHIDCLQKAVDKQESPSSQAQVESLRRENERLRGEASKLKKELVHWEVRNGVKQVSLPKSVSSSSTPVAVPTPVAAPVPQTEKKPEEKPKQEKKKAEKKEKGAPKQQAKKEEEKLDASRFNFIVGKIISIKKHPDADSLFVEEIDVGEQGPRTICSGLVGHIPMEKLQDAMVVVMANLKPVKMRGIFSQGMVMCAKADDQWSVVSPPNGAVPGDRVVFDAYPGTPDAQLNPKKKVWEQCAPDFTTNADGIPTYKGDPFKIPDKGICTSNGVKNGLVR